MENEQKDGKKCSRGVWRLQASPLLGLALHQLLTLNKGLVRSCQGHCSSQQIGGSGSAYDIQQQHQPLGPTPKPFRGFTCRSHMTHGQSWGFWATWIPLGYLFRAHSWHGWAAPLEVPAITYLQLVWSICACANAAFLPRLRFFLFCIDTDIFRDIRQILPCLMVPGSNSGTPHLSLYKSLSKGTHRIKALNNGLLQVFLKTKSTRKSKNVCFPSFASGKIASVFPCIYCCLSTFSLLYVKYNLCLFIHVWSARHSSGPT